MRLDQPVQTVFDNFMVKQGQLICPVTPFECPFWNI